MVYLSVANLARGGHTDPPPFHTPHPFAILARTLEGDWGGKSLLGAMASHSAPASRASSPLQDHVPTQGSPSPSQERLPPQEQVPPQGTSPPPQERPPTQGSPSSVHETEAQGRVTVAPRSTTARVAGGAEEKGMEFMRASVLTTNARYRDKQWTEPAGCPRGRRTATTRLPCLPSKMKLHSLIPSLILTACTNRIIV